ncbi:hypothetical protein D3Y57_06955 [Sphingomonas paeninsulae]|uniref:Surface-adhesin protein E-like domain-containing protein n=1 Tax=Sphingomonas paeninsulae TaxID=2319844 RepID=A0A494TIX1_SPHPE|nr:surface-adhesin E family protein [Sphingomonas paeninsulae]AYJ85756.1 hypothetical protein D3Y57_06955 [Sphingomonas paeninsulae]
MKRIILALALLSSPAFAEWEYLDTTETTKVFVDGSSIRPTGSNVRVWTKWINSPPDKGVANSMILYEVRCSEDSLGVAANNDYGPNDKLLNSRSYTSYQIRISPAAPGTIGAGIIQRVCR